MRINTRLTQFWRKKMIRSVIALQLTKADPAHIDGTYEKIVVLVVGRYRQRGCLRCARPIIEIHR